MKYRLKKSLPPFKKGDLLGQDDFSELARTVLILAQYPAIFEDWFEEIKDPIVELPGQYISGHSPFYLPCYEPLYNRIGPEPISCCYNEKSGAYASVGLSFAHFHECKSWIEKQKALQVLRRDAKGHRPDGENPYYIVLWNNCHKKLVVNNYCCSIISLPVTFSSLAEAQKSIKQHRKEWLTYLGVEG